MGRIMLDKLFKNKKFIFIFTFAIEFVMYYSFNHMNFGGRFFIPDMGLAMLSSINAVLVFMLDNVVKMKNNLRDAEGEQCSPLFYKRLLSLSRVVSGVGKT